MKTKQRPTGVKSSNNRLIVFCSVQPHDVPPPYLTRVAEAFSEKYPTIFIDIPSTQYLNGTYKTVKSYFDLLSFLLHPHGLVFWQPGRLLSNLHLLVFKLFLKAYKYIQGGKIILYTTSPKEDALYSYIKGDLNIFDCYDNPDNVLTSNSSNLRKYDLVFASFPMLFKILKSINPNARLVSSGIHDHLLKPSTKHKIPRSVVFFGGISHRISYEWIKKAVKEARDTEFFFIGQTYLNKYYTDSSDNNCLKLWTEILNEPNVHHWDTFINIETALEILSLFTVGIIPYEIEDSYNYNSHPIKFYDYIGSGLTVISTPIPSILEYKSKLPVYFAKTADEFVDLIKKYSARSRKDSPKSTRNINKFLKSQSLKLKMTQVEKIFNEMTV